MTELNDNGIMPTGKRWQAIANLRGDFNKATLVKDLIIHPSKVNDLLDELDSFAISVDARHFSLPMDEASTSRMREIVLKWLVEVIQ